MPSQTVQVAGDVLLVDTREGIGKTSGEPYKITTVRVLVESTGIAEVTLPRTIVPPVQGEAVQYLADVSVYQGQPQLRALASLTA
jgi:hypothetical protein